MAADVRVRPGADRDLDEVLRLQTQLAPQWTVEEPLPEQTERDREVWAGILADERRLVLVAELPGAVIGFVDVVVVHTLLDGVAPHAILDCLVVDHTRRGSGVGRALVSQARLMAVERGCRRLELLSSKERSDAHAFYRALGLEPVAEGFRQNLSASAILAS